MLTGLFRTLGFVRADRYTAAEQQLRKAQAHAEKLAQSGEDAKRENREWKTKAGDAERRMRDLEREVARQTERVEKVRADLAAQLESERARVVELQDALRQRLVESDRDLLVARDHLMAIEVKLDILEGAANVLDGRTRALLDARRQRETGAPV
jgi:chromosome segregation ATPase